MYVLILASCVAQVKDDYMNLVAAACVLVASKQGERPSQVPTDQQLESVTGLQVPALPCPALPCPALPCPAPLPDACWELPSEVGVSQHNMLVLCHTFKSSRCA